MKKAPLIAIAAVSAASWFGGAWVARAIDGEPPVETRDAALFHAAIDTVLENHVDGGERQGLYDGAAEGLLASLDDPYAELLRDDRYRSYNQRLSGTRLGLRLRLQPHEGGVTLSPSALGAIGADIGIGPLDEILEVNGESTEGWTSADAARALASDAGTELILLIRPYGSTRTEVRRVARAEVHVPAVSPGVMLSGRNGYLALHASTEAAPEELRAAIEALRARGMRRLVLDLRHNPGGLIPQAVEMASLFLDRGDTVAVTRGRTPTHSRIYVSRTPEPWPDMPLVLLVNGATASAAELMAAALQDHGRATVVGTTTFGKGVIQTTFPLREEVAVKFTTARWYTPHGHSIRRADSAGIKSGVLPDVTVPVARLSSRRALDRALGTDAELFNAVVASYVGNLRTRGPGAVLTTEVTPTMEKELWTQFEAAGARIDRAAYRRVASGTRERLRGEIIRQMWGEEAALRVELSDDRFVTTGVHVLNSGARTRR
ncbi:MAG TPA: S41 family peptidase [Gemmatimonadales bacterium]|nr:S41 family peptidase [Gemmatimonadales bacterium]